MKAGEELAPDVPVVESPHRRVPPSGPPDRHTRSDRDRLRNESVVSQSRLEAHRGAGNEPVRRQERVRTGLLERRSQGVQAAPQLVEAPPSYPAGELPPDVIRIDIPRQQETRFEEGLVAHEVEQLLEFHPFNLPKMASCRNESLASQPAPP